MRGINKILLENILPAHVAEHYLLRAQGVAGVLRDTNVSFVVGYFLLSFALVTLEAFMSNLLETSNRNANFQNPFFVIRYIKKANCIL